MQNRIRQLMAAQHMNQQAFANRTGIATASLSNIFSERTRPTLMHVEALMKAFPTLNITWLINGEGSMFVDEPSGASAGQNGLQSSANGDVMGQQNPGGSQSSVANGGQQGTNFSAQPTDKMAEPLSLFPEDGGQHKSVQNFGTQKDTRQNPAFSSQYGGQRGGMQQTSVAAVAPVTIHRKITEIRVFYDDQTWESFVPKK